MADFDIVNVPVHLGQRVSTYDNEGNLLPDDGAYQQRGAETQFVFAEFLKAKGLLVVGTDVSRRSDLTIKFSQLTEQGQAFTRAAFDKWIQSTDRAPQKPIDASGLERRWQKFIAT
jgi:hypothetical protein